MMEQEQLRYELFYGLGGHGGPYHGILAATQAAKRLACRATGWIYIVEYSVWAENMGKRPDQIACAVVKPE